MIYFASNGRDMRTSASGGLGCLLLGLIGLGFFFFGLYWFLKFLWWASPVVFALALLVHWRSVADTGRWLLNQLRTNPINGLLIAAFCVVAFPLFSLYLLLKAAGVNRLEKLKSTFEQQNRPPSDEFVDFEELESKPKEVKKLGGEQ